MISQTLHNEVETMIDEYYQGGKEGNMWLEAKGQCLESWLECSENYTDDEFTDCILDHLEYKTECWLEGHIEGCDDEQDLEEGGIYHWMIVAQNWDM